LLEDRRMIEGSGSGQNNADTCGSGTLAIGMSVALLSSLKKMSSFLLYALKNARRRTNQGEKKHDGCGQPSNGYIGK
jgi:hypothetical protein